MKWLSRIFKKQEGAIRGQFPPVFLTNTLSGRKEIFVPQKPGVVLLYSCGPTVYARAHIGNLRAFVFADTVARTLSAAGYHVRRVINITDVGHLVGDGDFGEDKVMVTATREHVTPEKIANRYTKLFLEDLDDLSIDTNNIQFPRATEYIKEQIALAKTIEEKGFAYRLADGLYFDTGKFPGYGKLGGLSNEELEVGARVKVVKEKHNPADFVLWRAAKPNDLQQWNSPWGRGNPGWHLECSAMVRALLGQEIDIHTGGEDLASIHHNNEIAQSESVSGRTFVHYWMHSAFLTMHGEKASKSLGNIVYLSEIVEKGFHPLSLRYFFFQAQYRTPLSFSWDALAGAAGALDRLWRLSRTIAHESKRKSTVSTIRNQFLATMRDDLATPQALGILWSALKSEEYTPEEKWGLLEDANAHLGLSLLNPPKQSASLSEKDVPKEVWDMLVHREAARISKDFKKADHIRSAIERSGYHVDDGPEGPVLSQETL